MSDFIRQIRQIDTVETEYRSTFDALTGGAEDDALLRSRSRKVNQAYERAETIAIAWLKEVQSA